MLIAYRDHLVRHRTVEAAYLDIVRRNLRFPHVLLNQIVHVILRNVLDGCQDAFVLRAAEMFFRPQKLTVHDGSLVAADEETVSGLSGKPLSPLVSMLGLPAAARSTFSARATPMPIGTTATCLTWRSTSPPAGAGFPRWAR